MTFQTMAELAQCWASSGSGNVPWLPTASRSSLFHEEQRGVSHCELFISFNPFESMIFVSIKKNPTVKMEGHA